MVTTPTVQAERIKNHFQKKCPL